MNRPDQRLYEALLALGEQIVSVLKFRYDGMIPNLKKYVAWDAIYDD